MKDLKEQDKTTERETKGTIGQLLNIEIINTAVMLCFFCLKSCSNYSIKNICLPGSIYNLIGEFTYSRELYIMTLPIIFRLWELSKGTIMSEKQVS